MLTVAYRTHTMQKVVLHNDSSYTQCGVTLHLKVNWYITRLLSLKSNYCFTILLRKVACWSTLRYQKVKIHFWFSFRCVQVAITISVHNLINKQNSQNVKRGNILVPIFLTTMHLLNSSSCLSPNQDELDCLVNS